MPHTKISYSKRLLASFRSRDSTLMVAKHGIIIFGFCAQCLSSHICGHCYRSIIILPVTCTNPIFSFPQARSRRVHLVFRKLGH